jgi:hypothetical protein
MSGGVGWGGKVEGGMGMEAEFPCGRICFITWITEGGRAQSHKVGRL